jgi:hypothetical protein
MVLAPQVRPLKFCTTAPEFLYKIMF